MTHKLSLLRPYNKFSNFSFLNLSRLSSISFLSCGIQIFSSLKRKEETIEGNKGGKENKGRAIVRGQRNIYTETILFFFPLCFSLLHPSAVFRSIIGGPVREETLFVSLTREEEGSEEEVAATAYIVQGCLPVYSGMKESV